jgi:hypothetical protein
MGYTVTVHPQTPELFAKMLEFGQKNFRRWSEISGGKSNYASDLKTGKDLSYDHDPERIGFDYSSGSADREYVHALCRWMAIRVGQRKDGIPQYIYDGYEQAPVEPRKFDRHGWWTPAGYDAKERSCVMRALAILGEDRSDQKIRAELIRLSKLWNELAEVKC